jgi:SPP1 gp7 family putative phage head morphogenesis protein
MATSAHSDYWRKRELDHIKAMNNAGIDYDAKIDDIYDAAINNIQTEIDAFYGKYATKEGITLAEAKQRVDTVDVQAFSNKAKKYVEEKDFSPEANDELRLYNATMKINRLELLKSKIALELVAMGSDTEKYVDKTLTGEAEEEVKRQAGILAQTLDTFDAKRIKQVVTGSYTDATFSQRIWGNNESLKRNLDTLLTQSIINGKHPNVLARDLKKQFGASQYEAERLMRTESARVQSQITMDSYKESGIKEYEWVSEPTACPTCSSLNGKHWKVEDAQVASVSHPMFPMHPNCRCAVIPVTDPEYDEWLDYIDKGGNEADWEDWKNGKGVAKNGQNGYNTFDKQELVNNNSILSMMVSALDNEGVDYNEIRPHGKNVTEQEIIQQLSGGDMTGGSCASLGLAYVGQKAGYKVLDYRGGKSQDYFSGAINVFNIMKFDGANQITAKARSEITAGKRLLKKIEKGKEYYFTCANHAAIVRQNTDGKYQYLELQSEVKEETGWTDFDGNPGYTLNQRFGAFRSGMDYMARMCDVQDLAQSDELKVLLGYLNTDESKQLKGAEGHVK